MSLTSKKSSAGDRFLVPDLSPRDRPILKNLKPKWVFVAESPHVSEVEPVEKSERRPLCGMAGKQWWGLLTELLEGESNSDVSLEHLLDFCSKHRLTVMNAIQYPLDPKVTRVFKEADPRQIVGFSKEPGEFFYKKKKSSLALIQKIEDLAERLNDPAIRHLPVYSLGLDSEWFVTRALEMLSAESRFAGRLPHPSAWWRRGGLFGRVAREKLLEILSSPNISKQESSSQLSL